MGIGKFKDITKLNFKLLHQYLNDAKPQINLGGDGDKLMISIKPKSMSGLRFNKFLIELPSAFANQRIRTTRFSWFEQNNEIKNLDQEEFSFKVGQNGYIDLYQILSGLSFFDALDNESFPLSRSYQVIIQTNHQGFNWSKYLDRNKIKVEIMNNVTGKIVTDNSVNLITKTKTDFGIKSVISSPKFLRISFVIF